MQTYEVVFSGALASGAVEEQVRAALQQRFGLSATVLEQFFSGRRIVVKRDLDLAAAEKYRQVFAQTGALLEVVAMTEATVAEPVPAAPAPAEPAAPAAGAAARPALQVEPRDEYMAAFVDVQAPDFGLADAGVDLLDEREELPVAEIDTSAMSLAPAGSDLEMVAQPAPPPPPDTSRLRVVED